MAIEFKDKAPDKVYIAEDGRRVEVYGQPSSRLAAAYFARLLAKEVNERVRKDVC